MQIDGVKKKLPRKKKGQQFHGGRPPDFEADLKESFRHTDPTFTLVQPQGAGHENNSMDDVLFVDLTANSDFLFPGRLFH